MSTRALVVEDDPRIAEEIEDTLDSIGHEHSWTDNLQDARKAVASEDFAYVLLDLEIPAKPNRGVALKENGAILLKEIQRIKGYKRLPVAVMTGHVAYGFPRAAEFLKAGASELIPKPFPTESHTLASVIQGMLEDHRQQMAADCGESGSRMTARFVGGEMVFFDDHVDLLGVKIISDRGAGLTMQLLRELRRRDDRGRYVCVCAEELAKALGVADINTVTGCVRALRKNITKRLRKHRNIDCRSEDVICHDEQGYHLHEGITVRDAGDASTAGDVPAIVPSSSTANREDVPAAECDVPAHGVGDAALSGLNDRQQWVLRELQRGTRVQRAMLEQRFDVADKTAKRDLTDLTSRGAVEFVRVGRGGYYRMATAG